MKREFDNFDELIGGSTKESIWSGVQNGFIKEILEVKNLKMKLLKIQHNLKMSKNLILLKMKLKMIVTRIISFLLQGQGLMDL